MKAKYSGKAVPVAVVKKAFDLLEIILFEAPSDTGVALSDLAQRLGMPRNSAHNILKSMVACGFVAQNAQAKYMPGAKCLHIGRWYRLTSHDMSEKTRQILTALTSRIGEASVFATLRGGNRVVLAAVEATQSVRVDRAVVENERFWCIPTGRILAAYAAPDELEKLLHCHGYPGAAWDGIADEQSLKKALLALRQAGECEIIASELVALACPVLDAAGGLLGALGVYAPLFRCPVKKRKKIADEMRAAVQRFTEEFSV